MKRIENANYQIAEEGNLKKSRNNNQIFKKINYQTDEERYFFQFKSSKRK